MSDNYGYDKMQKTELRKVIVDLLTSHEELVEDKKEYVKAINETIKEQRTRISVALGSLKAMEQDEVSDALERQADKILSNGARV